MGVFRTAYVVLFLIHLRTICSSDRKSYPAGGMHGLSCLSPECEQFLKLPYKPSVSVKDKFKAYGTHGFVFVSSHRISEKSFATVGLGARSLHSQWGKENDGCLWVSLDGPKGISGTLEHVFPGEHHGLTYEVLTIICHLKEPTSDTAGGALFVGVQGEDILVIKEPSGKRALNPESPFPHKVTFCSPPITHRIHRLRMLESLTYLRGIGADHFVLYDAGGVDPEMLSLLEPFDTAKELDIVDIRKQHLFKVWHPVVVSNECLYRTRYSSEWVLMHEFDDFLAVPPALSLGGLLEAHKEKPWLTFGTQIWGIEFCRPPREDGSEEWPMERMRFKWPHFFCSGDSHQSPDLCLSHMGLRRYALNPRRVKALEIHRVLDPQAGGVDLNATSFVINRFSGMSQPNALLCDTQVVKGKEPEWWVQDGAFESSIVKAKHAGLERIGS